MASSVLGSWMEDSSLDALKEEFKSAEPFEHVIIPNFFNESFAQSILDNWPLLAGEEPHDSSSSASSSSSSPPPAPCSWFRYLNPIENKYAMNKFDEMPSSTFRDLFAHLQSQSFVELMQKVTGIQELERDPLLHGAGLHYHTRGGKLDLHRDYSIHPVSGRERRVNLIVYMNKEWNPEYGGDLELWGSEETVDGKEVPTRCIRKVCPQFNAAVLFRTSDVSFHGMPRPLKCSAGPMQGRKSIAIYYVSPPRPSSLINPRLKAEFSPLPDQPVDERLAKLYEIRKTRTITADDLWPGWENDGMGYW